MFVNLTLLLYTAKREQYKSPPRQKPPNNEIIIQSYYICFEMVVILKDILEN